MKEYKIKVMFSEPVLGTVPKDKDVYAGYIATKAALTDEQIAEELATVESVEEKGWTGFHLVDGQPILYDYVVKGFFKGACGALRRVIDTRSKKITAYKKVIDGLVFVTPRRIPLILPEGAEMGTLERPLRAETAKGPRVALARSDTCPPGTTMEFTVTVLGVVSRALLEEWLSYGRLLGFGQWRSGGYGRFSYEMTEV